MYQFPLAPNQVVQFHGEITSYAGLRAVVTLDVLAIPTIFEISLNDDAEQWKFRHREVGEDDDNTSFLVPEDYDAVTNDNIWARIS